MKQTKDVIPIAKEHIDAGITKYAAKPDNRLNSLIKSAGLNYTSYVFNDGRVLLVMPENMGGFLYKSEEIMFETLQLGA